MEVGTGPHPGQYPAYPCTQPPGAWNNNVPSQHLANTYSLAGHGQPSPIPPGGQGGQSAPVPSPLYPWMRSQFGENFVHTNNQKKYFCIISELKNTKYKYFQFNNKSDHKQGYQEKIS